MSSLKKLFLILILSLLSLQNVWALEYSLVTTESEKASRLHTPAAPRSTVGVIPYCVRDGKIYFLLGQEDPKGSKEEARGKFSDFGGSTKEGSVLENLKREYEEETLNYISLREEDLLKQGLLLYKKTEKGRDVLYMFFPFSEAQVEESEKLNDFRHSPEAADLPDSSLEKVEFRWLNVKDLQKGIQEKPQGPFPVRTLRGDELFISLRKFFREDCFENKRFGDLISYILQHHSS